MSHFLSLTVRALAVLSLSSAVGLARPDSHAPIGVMGDHTHDQGEWMTSYRYMTMSMGPNYDGGSSVTPTEVLADFMVAPLNMTMDMHMVGAMYAPSDRLTLMAMFNYIEMDMDHVTRMGMEFTTKSDGFGDTGLSALYSLVKSDSDHVHLNLGMTLPTGEIDVRGATPMGPNSLLPYPMRLGSGTYDLKPGVTWTHYEGNWSFGAQALATLRLDENDRDYTLGDRLDLTTWAAIKITNQFSMSARLSYANWGDIDGADPRLNPMMVPTARPDLRGGSETTALVGLNYEFGGGVGHRLALEYGQVIDRDLDGPQLGNDDMLTLGWQWAF